MNSVPQTDGLLRVSQRQPPANLQAEQALLGALLANNKAYERVSEFLAAEHFADPVHGRIYAAIQRRIEAGQLADAVTLRGEFAHSGLLDELGGPEYLARLISAMVGIINAGDYGRIIHDAWLRRQLVDLGETVVNRAFGTDEGLEGREQLEAAEQALFDLAKDGGNEGGFVPFGRALTEAVTMAEKAFTSGGGVSGLSSGLRDLDAKTGGLHPSDLLILAGRPGMGKTALATKIAFGAAQSILRAAEDEHGPGAVPKGGCAIFSLEMSADQLATRLLSEASRISGDRIRRGEIMQRDFDKFVEVSRELARLPLYIDDTPAITISALRTRCRRLKRTRGLDFIVVDYLQLMRPAAGSRPENRVQEISQITQGLKAIAKELAVPVMALSQLSRQVESREDKRPQLSDLRESGSIEQDADMVMFVYRDDYYLKMQEPKQAAFDKGEKFEEAHTAWIERMEKAHNRADLIVAKQRHGPTGTIPLFFEAEFTRFGDLDITHGHDGY
ncbi:replicative DNA helicase [Pseudoroseomonas ludipueritiae]|uniref:Replicative DNA helicase n=1 Tax=Pseudoroseomonas ludipueritiae TaxID=198093 RepID=A0ABR7R3Q5_9PROT|nr:replicative DNA helicase [Pseudoroseomonas ludipueritiae]MBC9176358.1 replicative DNA helicase [Pseudoroseomonas ludipueritiae]